MKSRHRCDLLKGSLIAIVLLPVGQGARAQESTIRNQSLSVTVHSSDGSYEIQSAKSSVSSVHATVGVKVDGTWLRGNGLPLHDISESTFDDVLGPGRQLTVLSHGAPLGPELQYVIRLYDSQPYGEIQVEVVNKTAKDATIQSIRSVEGIGDQPVRLGPSEASDRVLSDSFSEDWPPLKIYDLGSAPDGLHLGVGSQLIYNRDAGEGLFFGALTSDRFLTIFHLIAGTSAGKQRITSFSIDSAGTTEIQSADEESGLRNGPAENRIELSLPVAPGASISSEPLMFATGNDYHAELENYGAAIRELHHARVSGENLLGWWSWTAFYYKITSGEVLTNAQWLAEKLKDWGYDLFHIDEGYQFARGEYTTPDATRFPEGMLRLEHQICRLSLRPGIWTAPFEVTNRTWVYENHKDWLVHNAHGEPIPVGEVGEGIPDQLFVLDATNPGAQEYLLKTYRTLVREWGIRYIKLDFMDTTAIEGYYYRPDTTALEAQRIGLETIRKAVGDDILLDKDGSPMLNVVGILDEGRISQDTGHAFLRSKEAAPGIFARYYMNRNFFLNDPDAFTVSKQVIEERGRPRALTLDEAQVSIVLSAVSGGMFEIGDDLPTLGSSPERLALVKNPDLLQMARLSRAAVPLDLLTYQPEDEQPSISFLREDARQSMLAVFNWTDKARSHALTLTELGLPSGDSYQISDVLNGNQEVPLVKNAIRLENQPAASVHLLKIIDTSIPESAPDVTASVPTQVKRGETANFNAQTSGQGVPALKYQWDFGDGVTGEGASTNHAYTNAGQFIVRLKVDGVDGLPAQKSFTVLVAGEVVTSPPKRYGDPEK